MANFPENELSTNNEESVFLNFKENGDYRIRVVGIKDNPKEFIEGWIGWRDKKPKRFPYNIECPNELIEYDEDRKPLYFWEFVIIYIGFKKPNENSMTVINKPKILRINQITIREKFLELENDSDWGDARGYDIVITRSKPSEYVKYSVSQKPKEPLNPELIKKVEDMNFDLRKLFSSEEYPHGNPKPFSDVETKKDDDIPF